MLLLLAASASAQDTGGDEAWRFETLQDTTPAAAGATLTFRHRRGDVRVAAADTDRVQVTAVAQYHRDDPRRPSIVFLPASAESAGPVELTVDFAALEVPVTDEAWPKRRIDVGLLIPHGVTLHVETEDGLIEVEKMTAPATLRSAGGAIAYDGAGDVDASSEHGSVRALLRRTGEGHTVSLTSSTGDVRCILLDGATAQVELDTRGSVTTDFSIEIERVAGTLRKTGRARVGEGGSRVRLRSHMGAIRLQGLIAAEAAEP